jgi:nucleotide-binding universal stress UspA family protein
MFRNILVSIDGSEHADRALCEAIDIAACHNSRLTILTAVQPPPPWAMTGMSAVAAETLATGLEREAQENLCNAVNRVPNSIPVTKILTHDPIRSALLHRIKEGTFDLLVMGSRGRGAVRSSLLGSVSHFALNHSPIPVLVIHANDSGLEDAPDGEAAELAAA